MIGNYLLVTKPGIVIGNMISIAGGFLLASSGHMDIAVMLSTISGVSLVVASGCVLNNCIDKDLDRLMARTRGRVLARGAMSQRAAVFYASVLGIGGMMLLLAMNNLLTSVIVLAGFVVYVGVYSLYLKRSSVSAPLIGSLAGAAPPLAGYCAVSNRLDTEALILLLIFALWQVPHFYAIAIYRLGDYTAAAIPVLPLRRGVPAAKKRIIGYILACITAALMLSFGGYTGGGYLVAVAAVGIVWLAMAWMAYRATDDRPWARKLFVCSIVIIFVISVMMSVDTQTPTTVHVLATDTL